MGDNVANVYPHLYNIHSSLLASNNHVEPTDPKQVSCNMYLGYKGYPKGFEMA